jgi:hypothetical protein
MRRRFNRPATSAARDSAELIAALSSARPHQSQETMMTARLIEIQGFAVIGSK